MQQQKRQERRNVHNILCVLLQNLNEQKVGFDGCLFAAFENSFFCVCRQLLFRVSVYEHTFVMYVRAFFCSNCNDNMLKQLGGIAYSCNLMTQPTNLLLLCFCCHFIVTFLILLIFSFAILIRLCASVFVLYRIYFYNLTVFFFNSSVSRK